MKNGLYLSDVLDLSDLKHDCFNIIVAPCGCGKTHAAIYKLASQASTPRKALFLIDTRNGNLRLAKEDGITLPYAFYEDSINFHYFFGEDFPQDKIVATTYAQFGVWAERNPDFASYFDIIVCDEVHNLPTYATFSPEPNCVSQARDALCFAAEHLPSTLIVGITATPKPLKWLNCQKHRVPIDTTLLRQYENLSERSYASLPLLMKHIPRGQRGMLYVKHISQMITCAEIASAEGHKPICVWSTSNPEHPMTEEQLAARNYILEHEEIPPQYDLFIFNASSETAINIRGQMDYIITHTSNPTNLTQARGRYRDDLKVLYYYDKENGEIIVPEEFLDIRLFAEDKQQLRAVIGLKDDKGHDYAYNKLFARLEQNGYSLEYGRVENRHYLTIHKK